MPNLKNKVVTYMTLSADASTCNSPSQVYAKKSDANSRYLVVRIVDANGNIDVQGNAQLNATKPDGTHVYVGGDTNDDGTVTILLKSSVLALDGKVSCDITVFDKEDNETVVLTTSTFFILVADSNYKADALESTNEFSMSAEMIAQVAEDRRTAEQARDEAGEALMNIENIVSQGSLANALKGNASGEAVRMDDISPIEHEMAVRVSGKNLFNNDTSKIAEIHYTGQSGAVGTRFGYTLRLPAGTYTAYAEAIDEATKTGYIYGVLNTKDAVFKRTVNLVADAYRPKITFNVDEGDVLYIYNGVKTITAATTQELFAKFNIQIEIGATATDYEPYIDTSLSYGKNLLPPFFTENKTYSNGSTVEVTSTGGFKIHKEAELNISVSKVLPLKAGAYTLSDSVPAGGKQYWLQITDVDMQKYYGTTQSTGYTSVILPTDAEYKITFFIDGTTEFDTMTFYPQLEKGVAATYYQPYVEPGPVKVKKYGKNLLSYPFTSNSKTEYGITWTDNGDGTVRANGTAEATVSFSFASTTEMNWLGGKVISVSGCPSGGNTSSAHYIRMQFIRAGSGIVMTVDDIGNGKKNIKVPDGIISISFFAAIRAGASAQNLVFKPQIELGEVITDYAPCISQVEYIPNEDGTVDGVTAFYPTTTLVTSTEGIIFDTSYNRDANKIIADILSRLSALETAAIT